MKKTYPLSIFIFILVCTSTGLVGCSSDKVEEIGIAKDFNFDWEFMLMDSISGEGKWKSVQIPHDWSVEASFDSIKGEGATGYLPGGIGVYRKEFPLQLKDDQMAYLLFDGVYNNTTVILNGQELGFHPYGYSPFYFDISSKLGVTDNHLLQVKVDRSRYADSRWYTGSGIYRNVQLLVKNKLHIPVWGVFLTTPKVSKDQAQVVLEIQVKNALSEDKNIQVVTELWDQSGKKVASKTSQIAVSPNQKNVIHQKIGVNNPMLWDIDNPSLYRAEIKLVQNNNTVDRYETSFGIRSFRFDVDEGFFLNGKNLKIKGVCLHHDAGLVGAAVPKGVWKRRLSKLKKAGCNAIRSAHNPASQEFLELCDEMGFLVQDEFFDEWDNPKDKRKNMNEQTVDYITRGYTEHFQEWAEKDLKNTVLAHRNHPSIIQWSIGNEIEWTYPRNGDATGFFNNMHWSGNYFWELPPYSPKKIRARLSELPKAQYDIGETARKLAKWTRELDTTRYIIANCILPSASHESGYTDALDMVGYSYRRVLYDYGHENYPDKPIMGTENLGQWHEWKAVMDRPFISGTFLWTGIDYMGESNGGWPKKGSASGLLDMAGFEKPSYHMFKSLWNDEPHIYLATQIEDRSIYKVNSQGDPVERKTDGWKRALWGWHDVNEHWNYDENQTIVAEVYSNCESVELFLNENSLGVKNLADFNDRVYKWAVPYEKGVLKAIGKRNGKTVQTQVITSSKPVSLELSLDKEELEANGYDVAHLVVQLKDAKGNPVKSEEKEITFEVEGDIRILGVDNGSIRNVQDYRSQSIVTYKGRCMLIVQSTRNKSKINIKAISKGLKSDTIKINSK